jgi:CDP-glucose 4,6-dehydratase
MESVVTEDNLFGGIYRNKKIAITGNTGFKGSWLALWLERLGAEVFGFSLDDHGSNSHFNLLRPGYSTTYGDIRSKKSLDRFFQQAQPDLVFHMAAQSLVRESYRQPYFTYETNILGTLNVLLSAIENSGTTAIVNVTTDKVYENVSSGTSFTENDPLGGYDMYSSSKACSEILTSSFRRSFLSERKNLLASARAGNVIGGGDWAADRLIPDVMRAVMQNADTLVRNPGAVRPWQHVLEPLSGYLHLGRKLLEGGKDFASAYNFGPQKSNATTVGEVLQVMHLEWDSIRWRTEKSQESFHEASFLMLDSAKAIKELGWLPVWNLEKSISRTVQWYRSFIEKQHVRSPDDLADYIRDAAEQNKKRTA